MIGYLTQKLRAAVLNGSSASRTKGSGDHDSGTESDNQSAEMGELQKYMERNIRLADTATTGKEWCQCHYLRDGQQRGRQAAHKEMTVVAESPVTIDSALSSDSDHSCDNHSSEEELEMINRRAGSAEKKKWSQASRRRTKGFPHRAHSNGVQCDSDTASSDDDDVCELTKYSASLPSCNASSSPPRLMTTPVEFRTTPPLHAHRPRNDSPPVKFSHAAGLPVVEVCSVSPHKSYRQDVDNGDLNEDSSGASSFTFFSLEDGGPVPRPCLDFEKMQQTYATWGTERHSAGLLPGTSFSSHPLARSMAT